MAKAYDIVKRVYEEQFSDDDPNDSTDPLFHMLERLFFAFTEERTMTKVDAFMSTLPAFQNKDRITKMLHYYITQADSYPWPEGHSVLK